MMEFLALTSLHGKLPFIPLAFADTAASHLIEGSSSRLVASPSEAETDTSARTGSVWGCAIESSHFTGSSEISAGVKDKNLGSQDVTMSWKRCEYVTMCYATHHILDLPVIFFYLFNQQTELLNKDVLESGLGPENLLGGCQMAFPSFPYLLIRYVDGSDGFVVFSDVVSNILSVSLIR